MEGSMGIVDGWKKGRVLLLVGWVEEWVAKVDG